MESSVDPQDRDAVAKVAKEARIRFPSIGAVELDGRDVSDKIRTSAIVQNINPIASNPSVRSELAEKQRAMARGSTDQNWPGFQWRARTVHGVVMDGRDIGTVILPDAELKVFIIADAKVRAQRRFDELAAKNSLAPGETVESIAHDLHLRDEADRTRKVSPLKKADDAIELDTSNRTIDEQVAAIEEMIYKRLDS